MMRPASYSNSVVAARVQTSAVHIWVCNCGKVGLGRACHVDRGSVPEQLFYSVYYTFPSAHLPELPVGPVPYGTLPEQALLMPHSCSLLPGRKGL